MVTNIDLDLPWTEKYRTSKIEDIYTQDSIKSLLLKVFESDDLPNLLLYGPSGTGKTSTILSIAKQLFGQNVYKSRILELNASDDRGINIVRDKIKRFANSSISAGDENYPSPNFKIVILDEADNITIDAQSALRRIIETTSKITRFCIICNNITRIIDPISSRCAKFRYSLIRDEDMKMKLNGIIKNEDIEMDNNVVGEIIKYSNGDLRKAISYLQSTHLLTEKNQLVTLYQLLGVLSDEDKELLKKILLIDDITDNIVFVEYLISKGFSYILISEFLIEHIYNDDNLDTSTKSIIILHIGRNVRMLVEGAEEFIILLNIISGIRSILTNKLE